MECHVYGLLQGSLSCRNSPLCLECHELRLWLHQRRNPLFCPLERCHLVLFMRGNLGIFPPSPLYLIRTQTISHFHSFLRLNYTLLSLVSSLFNANHLTQSSQLHCQPNRSILWSFQPTHNLWNSGTPFCGFYLVHILCSLFCSHQKGWPLLSSMLTIWPKALNCVSSQLTICGTLVLWSLLTSFGVCSIQFKEGYIYVSMYVFCFLFLSLLCPFLLYIFSLYSSY